MSLAGLLLVAVGVLVDANQNEAVTLPAAPEDWPIIPTNNCLVYDTCTRCGTKLTDWPANMAPGEDGHPPDLVGPDRMHMHTPHGLMHVLCVFEASRAGEFFDAVVHRHDDPALGWELPPGPDLDV